MSTTTTLSAAAWERVARAMLEPYRETDLAHWCGWHNETETADIIGQAAARAILDGIDPDAATTPPHIAAAMRALIGVPDDTATEVERLRGLLRRVIDAECTPGDAWREEMEPIIDDITAALFRLPAPASDPAAAPDPAPTAAAAAE